MTETEKLLTELREASLTIQKMMRNVLMDNQGSEARDRFKNALADFTADMPGAIGVVIRRTLKGGHGAECAMTGLGWRCVCGLSDALAKLKGGK